MIKKTALNQIHKDMGGKMVEFANYEMPLLFQSVNTEHQIVREKLGVFDVSHMGEFMVEGENAYDFVQKITSNDVATLTDGKVQYTCFPNKKGGIVDDLLIYRLSKQKYLLVVNASNIKKDWDWCCLQNDEQVEISDLSDEYSQLAIQGPLALKAMQNLCAENVINMPYYTFKNMTFAGVDDVLFSTTGYTGSGGCEIYMKNKDAVNIYNAVLKAGKEFGIMPIGLAARDTLRLESGFCLYGNDIDDKTSPIEAGLGWITKFVNGNNFINRSFHQDLKKNGVSKKLRGIEMIDRGFPRKGYEICDENGNKIGVVTSGTMLASVKNAICMGYVKKEFSKYNTEIRIRIRKKLLRAKIVKLPFYKN